jgi:hypothetical protein
MQPTNIEVTSAPSTPSTGQSNYCSVLPGSAHHRSATDSPTPFQGSVEGISLGYDIVGLTTDFVSPHARVALGIHAVCVSGKWA